jgi:hypothetical protein
VTPVAALFGLDVAASEPTAVLVIRAWLEEGTLRARITRTLDVSRLQIVESAAASEEEVLETVHAWFLEFTSREQR